MSLLLQGARFVDPTTLEIQDGDLLVEEGTPDADGDAATVLDCRGRLVTHSFAIAHHHIYSALARGMPPPAKPPRSFVEVLERIWWKLDRQLDEDMIRASAAVAAVEAARCGVTFVVDHHSSPEAAPGSLHIIAEELERVGLGHLLCYELSDRDGPERLREGIAETERYLSKRQGLVGLHASFTVSDDLLHEAVALAKSHRTGVHVHVAEAVSDQEHCLEHHGCRVVERFAGAGALASGATLLAHCLHLDEGERSLVADSEAWVVQNTESNQNNAVGSFDPRGLGDRIAIGTDGMHGDALASARAAFLAGQTTGGLSPLDAYRRLRRVHDYVEQNGFVGDGPSNLVVLRYDEPTPVTEDNWPATRLLRTRPGPRPARHQRRQAHRARRPRGQRRRGRSAGPRKAAGGTTMAEAVIDDLTIDAARLEKSLSDLAAIGAYRDEVAGLTGVNRLALTDADAAGRRQVVAWFEAAGLAVTVDQIGNVYGRRAGEKDELAPVMAGSHIDSVPTGGAFDGALGVLGALEVVRTLDDHGVTTPRPLVIGFFTDEEGCRFGTDMLGSAIATGRIELEHGYGLTDRDGLSIRSELERIGFLGEADVHAQEPHAYVECHIEQGPVLRAKNLDIGVVTGVQAISWLELTISGKSCHAGTTPIEFRRDPGLAAAEINLEMRRMATSGDYGSAMRATMGSVRPVPDMINVVPSRVVATVDLRNPDDVQMERAQADLLSFCNDLEQRHGLGIEHRQIARTAAIPFDAGVREVIASKAAALGLAHESILSGAGHDAQEWAKACKTAMVFVPGEYDGISHNPREFSTPTQCAHGVNVLLHTMLELAREA